jgi:hypothetical protein
MPPTDKPGPRPTYGTPKAPEPASKPQDGPQGSQEPVQGDQATRDQESTVPAPRTAPAGSQEPETKKKWDETIPGGAYEVGGRMVDAHGKPLKAKALKALKGDAPDDDGDDDEE